jgi:TetR/AcrR family transcriptional regulator
MVRTRLASADRRLSIIAAARSVFAEHGYEGARTQQIAEAAQVSEALIYRHFPSKTALYRAVLRSLIEEQDRIIADVAPPSPSAQGLVEMLHALLRHGLQGDEAPNAEGVRVLLASLAGDSSFARLVYRRAQRLTYRHMDAALAAAVATGEARDASLSSTNAIFFMTHVSAMLQASRRGARPAIDYVGAPDAILREAVWFCGRGLGLTDDALQRYYPAAAEEAQTGGQQEPCAQFS